MRSIVKSLLWHENLNTEAKVTVNQGGTSSGKTYSLVDMFFFIALREKAVITVCGQDIPNLKSGAFRDALEIWQNEEYRSYFTINRSDRIFTALNGSIIEFKSFADEQDAKSGKRDYLFVNEANGVKYEIYWQLAIRTKNKIYLDYNPTAEFWVHEKILNQPNTRLIISDHRHNPFISEELHNRIESIEDPELFRVYARGLTGKLKDSLYGVFKEYTQLPTAPIKIANYTDTADSGKDYLCSVSYMVDKIGNIYVIDVVYTDEPMEVTEPLVAQSLIDNEVRIAYIESNNGGRGFARNVQKLAPQTKVEWFYQSGNKEARILTNSANVTHSIYMPMGWRQMWSKFARSIESFRKDFKANKNDDAADVLTGIIEREIFTSSSMPKIKFNGR